MSRTYIGTAGWTISKHLQALFPEPGTHLARYAQRFNCVEISSSFYREHQASTYAKWAELVPDDFRFSVKLSRYFTQEMRLRETGPRLREVLSGLSHLGHKWGMLLIQLPPSLVFEEETARRFLNGVREEYEGDIAWEPCHVSWSSPAALNLLAESKAAKVFADPERCPLKVGAPRRLETLNYYRLHGSPVLYESRYSETYIRSLASMLGFPGQTAWCVFDNTGLGFATENAFELQSHVSEKNARHGYGELSTLDR